MIDIAVVDYGMGNLRSVYKALRYVAPERRIEISADPEVIAAAARVVVPGQSAMPDTMRALRASGLEPVVLASAAVKPFLGICLGLQMLFEHSEEGATDCLGIFPGQVQKFRSADMHDAGGNRLKVPHMGWSPVRQRGAHALWQGIADHTRFYFAHSFHPVPVDPGLTLGTVDYGTSFTCAVGRANIFAVQFHPEKSHTAGLQLLANFVAWNGHP
jgi:glutamine amidotransferase